MLDNLVTPAGGDGAADVQIIVEEAMPGGVGAVISALRSQLPRGLTHLHHVLFRRRVVPGIPISPAVGPEIHLARAGQLAVIVSQEPRALPEVAVLSRMGFARTPLSGKQGPRLQGRGLESGLRTISSPLLAFQMLMSRTTRILPTFGAK